MVSHISVVKYYVLNTYLTELIVDHSYYYDNAIQKLLTYLLKAIMTADYAHVCKPGPEIISCF